MHVAHGKPVDGLRSLGLRTLLPIGGLIAGTLLISQTDVCGSGDLQALCYFVAGGIPLGTAGLISAQVFDYMYLARKPGVDDDRPPDTGWASLSPVLAPRPGGATLSVLGSW